METWPFRRCLCMAAASVVFLFPFLPSQTAEWWSDSLSLPLSHNTARPPNVLCHWHILKEIQHLLRWPRMSEQGPEGNSLSQRKVHTCYCFVRWPLFIRNSAIFRDHSTATWMFVPAMVCYQHSLLFVAPCAQLAPCAPPVRVACECICRWRTESIKPLLRTWNLVSLC